MDAIKNVGILLQATLLLVLLLEFGLYHRMVGTYARVLSQLATTSVTVSPGSLAGAPLATDSLVLRYDEGVDEVRFRRKVPPRGSAWGHVIGIVQLDENGAVSIRWHPPMLGLPGAILLLGLFGAAVFWLRDGQWQVAAALPLVVLVVVALWWSEWHFGRQFLDQHAVPEIVEALRGQADPTAPPG